MSTTNTINFGTSYTRILRPKGVGLLTDIAAYTETYPSRDQWGAFLALHDGTDWRVVSIKNANSSLVSWRLYQDGSDWKLDITHLDDSNLGTIDDTTYSGVPEDEWRTAVASYRTWARGQSWAQKRKVALNTNFDHVQFGSAVGGTYLTGTMIPYLSSSTGALAYLTRTRANPSGGDWIGFHDNFPEYGRIQSDMVTAMTTYRNNGHAVMIYVNALEWDDANADYSSNTDLMLVQSGSLPAGYSAHATDDFVDVGDNDADGPMGSEFPAGKRVLVCPSQHATFGALLRTEFDAAQDSNNVAPEAVYLDFGTAATPCLCEETAHGHAANDARVWIEGMRNILGHFSDVDICAEFPGEMYINYCDMAGAWGAASETRDANRVPMYPHFYADRIRILGWDINPGDSEQTQVQEAALAVRTYGVYRNTPTGSLSTDADIDAMSDGRKAYFYASYPSTTLNVGTGGEFADWSDVPWVDGETYDGQGETYTVELTVTGGGSIAQNFTIDTSDAENIGIDCDDDVADLTFRDFTVMNCKRRGFEATVTAATVVRNMVVTDFVIDDIQDVAGLQFGMSINGRFVTVSNGVIQTTGNDNIDAVQNGSDMTFSALRCADPGRFGNGDNIQVPTGNGDNIVVEFCNLDNDADNKQCVIMELDGVGGKGTITDTMAVMVDDSTNGGACLRVNGEGIILRNNMRGGIYGALSLDEFGTAPESQIVANVSDKTGAAGMAAGTNAVSAMFAQNTCYDHAADGGWSNANVAGVSFYNNIFTTNGGFGLNKQANNTEDYNCVHNNTSGAVATNDVSDTPASNDITDDPLLLDPANRDFRLQPGSPCARAGTKWWSDQPFDYLGNKYKHNGVDGVDIGSFSQPTGRSGVYTAGATPALAKRIK